jgi:hypothetical protein
MTNVALTRRRVRSADEAHRIGANIILSDLSCLDWSGRDIRSKHERLGKHSRLPVLRLWLGIRWVASWTLTMLDSTRDSHQERRWLACFTDLISVNIKNWEEGERTRDWVAIVALHFVPCPRHGLDQSTQTIDTWIRMAVPGDCARWAIECRQVLCTSGRVIGFVVHPRECLCGTHRELHTDEG